MTRAISRRWRLVSLLFASALLVAQPAPAATGEAQVKAAYIYKFASFVRWPDEGGDAFRICVAGRSDIAAVLQDLVRGQRVAGRPVTVAQVAAGRSDQARGCRILYLGRGSDSASALIKATDGAPVLTVCDRSGGTRGGVIEFVLRDGRVRFAVNRTLADRRRLELNAKLIEVAVP